MSCVGFQEGLIILAIVVVIMGVGRLPQIGDALGRSLLNFRRGYRGEDQIDVTPDPRIEPGDDEPPKA